MAKDLLYNLRVNVLCQEQCRARVTQIMNADYWQFRRHQQLLEIAPNIAIIKVSPPRDDSGESVQLSVVGPGERSAAMSAIRDWMARCDLAY